METLSLKEDFMHDLFHQALPDSAAPGGFSLLNLGGAAVTLGTWQFSFDGYLSTSHMALENPANG